MYSFYRVVANAFVYVWSQVLVRFFNTAIHGDYTLAHFLRLIVPMIVLNLSFIWCLFKVPSIAAELFGGIGNVGATMASEIRGLLRAAT